MSKKYTIQIQKDKHGMFVGEVVGLPTCYTQAKTIPQLLERIIEVSEWSVENSEMDKNKAKLVKKYQKSFDSWFWLKV